MSGLYLINTTIRIYINKYKFEEIYSTFYKMQFFLSYIGETYTINNKKYKILENISIRKYQQTYKSIDERRNEFLIRICLIRDEIYDKRFQRVINIGYELNNCENILRLKDHEKKNDELFLVYEYYESNLRSYVSHGEVRGLESEYPRSFYNLLHALNSIHKNGYIHGGISPENIVCLDNVWKLSDFYYMQNHNEVKATSYDDDSLSQNFLLYRAPELVDGSIGNISAKSDIWSLGCTFYKMCTGKDPFSSESAILKNDINWENIIINEKLADIIRKCLQVDPAQRPTAEELAVYINSNCIIKCDTINPDTIDDANYDALNFNLKVNFFENDNDEFVSDIEFQDEIDESSERSYTQSSTNSQPTFESKPPIVEEVKIDQSVFEKADVVCFEKPSAPEPVRPDLMSFVSEPSLDFIKLYKDDINQWCRSLLTMCDNQIESELSKLFESDIEVDKLEIHLLILIHKCGMNGLRVVRNIPDRNKTTICKYLTLKKNIFKEFTEFEGNYSLNEWLKEHIPEPGRPPLNLDCVKKLLRALDELSKELNNIRHQIIFLEIECLYQIIVYIIGLHTINNKSMSYIEGNIFPWFECHHNRIKGFVLKAKNLTKTFFQTESPFTNIEKLKDVRPPKRNNSLYERLYENINNSPSSDTLKSQSPNTDHETGKSDPGNTTVSGTNCDTSKPDDKVDSIQVQASTENGVCTSPDQFQHTNKEEQGHNISNLHSPSVTDSSLPKVEENGPDILGFHSSSATDSSSLRFEEQGHDISNLHSPSATDSPLPKVEDKGPDSLSFHSSSTTDSSSLRVENQGHEILNFHPPSVMGSPIPKVEDKGPDSLSFHSSSTTDSSSQRVENQGHEILNFHPPSVMSFPLPKVEDKGPDTLSFHPSSTTDSRFLRVEERGYGISNLHQTPTTSSLPLKVGEKGQDTLYLRPPSTTNSPLSKAGEQGPGTLSFHAPHTTDSSSLRVENQGHEILDFHPPSVMGSQIPKVEEKRPGMLSFHSSSTTDSHFLRVEERGYGISNPYSVPSTGYIPMKVEERKFKILNSHPLPTARTPPPKVEHRDLDMLNLYASSTTNLLPDKYEDN